MKDTLSFLRLCLMALLAASSLYAWGQNTNAGPIKVGLIEALSGPLANTGESVYRNLKWGVDRVNARGGVRLGKTHRPLELIRYDSKGQTDEALRLLKAAKDDGVSIIMQGNSSAIALALVDALNKHNVREPDARMVFLNYSAVEPSLTNENCSPWHFRFDAHADMRMAALMRVLRADRSVRRVFLLGQDYSFGQAVLREARRQLAAQRPDIQIVGDELHPMAKLRDFSPYASKLVLSRADAVITGNWGNDLTQFIKSAKEAGYKGKFYTFYGNALGAPAAIGEAGIGRVIAVADWLPNLSGAANERFYRAFRAAYPDPKDDYVHMRMQVMMEMLVKAIEKTGKADAASIARGLKGLQVRAFERSVVMRARDHQLQQPLVVGLMERQGAPGVKFDVEGSGYGFKVIETLSAKEAELPSTCNMATLP